jgi:ribosome-associated translation inhibitor RaiA
MAIKNFTQFVNESISSTTKKEVEQALAKFADYLNTDVAMLGFLDKFANEQPTIFDGSVVEISIAYSRDGEYLGVRMKAPTDRKKITFDWLTQQIEKKLLKSNTQKESYNLFKQLSEKIKFGYPTTYGIGKDIFGKQGELQKLEILEKNGIVHIPQYSDSQYVIRYVIPKSKENLKRVQDFINT